MKFINENLKKAGYFNAVLIVLAIVLRLRLSAEAAIIIKIDSIVTVIALVFGLIYALNGYKKESAKYYKGFMCLYLISSAVSILSPALAPLPGASNNVLTVINGIIFVLIAILAFVKDLGVNKSTTIAASILLLNVVKLFLSNKISIHGIFANFVLACVMCVFVTAKYRDKESRGTI